MEENFHEVRYEQDFGFLKTYVNISKIKSITGVFREIDSDLFYFKIVFNNDGLDTKSVLVSGTEKFCHEESKKFLDIVSKSHEKQNKKEMKTEILFTSEKFQLCRLQHQNPDHPKFWLQRTDKERYGEGMGFNKDLLEKYLEKLYDENF